ncbi:MAG: DUF3737 family protein [Clostridiales bacterium]|nr:DUF3737 family protein [Clostridiales bacterium]
MCNKREINEEICTGERSLFGAKDIIVRNTIFEDGESPLKESENIDIYDSMFKWKYPLWYSKNINVENSTWFEMARAGVWYTNNINIKNCAIEAPKDFRRCRDISLQDVSIPNAAETLWNCENVELRNVIAKGDYFAMNCKDMAIEGLTLYGNF